MYSIECSGRWEFIVAGGNAMGAQLGALQGQREAGGGSFVRWWKDFLYSLICFSKRKCHLIGSKNNLLAANNKIPVSKTSKNL